MRNLKKFFTVAVMLMMFADTSWADIIYTTSDGVLGSIAVNSSRDIKAPSTHYRSGITEPLLASYWNGSGTNIMLIDPIKTGSGDRAYIFNPTNLSSPTASEDIEGVYGASMSDYARNGRSVFLASDSELYEVFTGSFNVVNSFDYRRILSSDNHDTEIVSVLVDYNFINAIIGCGDARRYVRFDGQMKEKVTYFLSADIGADASCLFTQNGTVYAGYKSGITALNLNGKFVKSVSTDATVTAICDDDDGRLYYATTESTDVGYVFTVTNVQNSSLRTKFQRRETISDYPYIKLMRDSDKNILAVMTGESISLFDVRSGRLLREFTASELGGRPFGMVMSKASGYNDSSSSGCSMQAGGQLLMLIAGFLWTAWKKKTL